MISTLCSTWLAFPASWVVHEDTRWQCGVQEALDASCTSMPSTSMAEALRSGLCFFFFFFFFVFNHSIAHGAIDQGVGGRRRVALVWDSIPTVGPLSEGRGPTANDFLRVMRACMIMPKLGIDKMQTR